MNPGMDVSFPLEFFRKFLFLFFLSRTSARSNSLIIKSYSAVDICRCKSELHTSCNIEIFLIYKHFKSFTILIKYVLWLKTNIYCFYTAFVILNIAFGKTYRNFVFGEVFLRFCKCGTCMPVSMSTIGKSWYRYQQITPQNSWDNIFHIYFILKKLLNQW